MNIVYINIDEIKPYEKNPRKNDQAVDAVANSIKEFGFKNPILLNKENVIIGGHTRYKAAKKLGMNEVPCIIVSDLTPEQEKALRLADNKTGELAEWDLELLNEELDGIIDINMKDFGFEIDLPEEATEIIEDEFDETLPDNPKAKPGYIYRLGRHRLMCGDSTDPECVKKLVGGGCLWTYF